MSASSTPSRLPAPALAVIAGAGSNGCRAASELLRRVQSPRCPVIVALRACDPADAALAVAGHKVRHVEHGASVSDASVWLASGDRHTMVRDKRLVVETDAAASNADTPSLGKLYHSVRLDYGSRVFAVVADDERNDGPSLRLLAQRGAGVVSPRQYDSDAVPRHWTLDDIAVHLGAEVAAGGASSGPPALVEIGAPR